jgi:hypothetical protein
VQIGPVLEEVEVPPLLVRCVVYRAVCGSTVGARKARAALEVDEQIEAPLRRIELKTDDLPRRDKTEGFLEELLDLVHGATSATVALSSRPPCEITVTHA